MKSLKDLFSLKRYKSDDDIVKKTHRRSFSASSLANLTNFVLPKWKSVSLIKINSDNSLTSSFRACSEDDLSRNVDDSAKSSENKLKRVRNCDESDNCNNNNVTKRMKQEENMEIDGVETLNLDDKDKVEYKSVTLRAYKNQTLGLELHPKWTFASNEITGYYVSHIIPGSVADRNKILKTGDEIIKVNGKKMTDVLDLFRRDETLELIIARRKQTKSEDTFLSTTTRETDEVFKIPTTITGMKKFTNSPSTAQRKNSKIPNYTEEYCGVSGELRLSVRFFKGPGSKSLGFSVVGGNDSPKGCMAIYIKTIFEYGQAAELGVLREGDEIVSVNNKVMKGLTHEEAVQTFKSIKNGYVFIEVVRRSQPRFRHSF